MKVLTQLVRFGCYSPFVVVALICYRTSAQGTLQQITVPPEYAQAHGGQGIFLGTGWEQVYSSADFAALPSTPISISSITFRTTNPSFGQGMYDFEIHAAAFPFSPSALNRPFYNDIKALTTYTVVRALGSEMLVSANQASITLPFTTPFVYSSSEGSLWLSVQSSKLPDAGISLEVGSSQTDYLLQKFTGGPPFWASAPGAVISTFSYQPIPEPRWIEAFVSAAVVTLLLTRKRRR